MSYLSLEPIRACTITPAYTSPYLGHGERVRHRHLLGDKCTGPGRGGVKIIYQTQVLYSVDNLSKCAVKCNAIIRYITLVFEFC